MQDEDSWFSLLPEFTHRDRPAIFGLIEISSCNKGAFDESQDAGMSTNAQLSVFGAINSLTQLLEMLYKTFHENSMCLQPLIKDHVNLAIWRHVSTSTRTI